MNIFEFLAVLGFLVSAAALIVLIIILIRLNNDSASKSNESLIQQIEKELSETKQDTIQFTAASISSMSTALNASFETLRNTVSDSGRNLSERFSNFSRDNENRSYQITANIESKIKSLEESNSEKLESMRKLLDDKLEKSIDKTEQKMEYLRNTVENKLISIQEDNNKQLEEMRKTVDEKLQKSLEERFNESFRLVSDRLDQVYKGLGEMQNLASGVGDLKKVLSNVKTRGILGEVQLGAILCEILSPEQYEENYITKHGSRDPVEYAVKMPGIADDTPVYLPIDAKFPLDAYTGLLDAYEIGDKSEIDRAGRELDSRIKSFAKDISTKYLDPPNTTDFAIMFLPVEGLYAEVVRRGLVEILQKTYKINIAGPTTMAALLNSLQMGFRTLAIQKKSNEAWKVLENVKKEFSTFGSVLEATQKRITQANEELDKLVGVRTRQIQSQLNKVALMSPEPTVTIESNDFEK